MSGLALTAATSDFRIEAQAGYIQVELVQGYAMQAQGTRQLILAIAQECERRQCRRVLVEGREVRRGLGTVDAFALGTLMGSVLPGASFAFCLHGYSPDPQSKFLIDVTWNRGVRVEFFSERAAARRWLGVADPQP